MIDGMPNRPLYFFFTKRTLLVLTMSMIWICQVYLYSCYNWDTRLRYRGWYADILEIVQFDLGMGNAKPLHLFEDIAMKHSERNCFILRMGKFGIINDDFGFYNQQYGWLNLISRVNMWRSLLIVWSTETGITILCVCQNRGCHFLSQV